MYCTNNTHIYNKIHVLVSTCGRVLLPIHVFCCICAYCWCSTDTVTEEQDRSTKLNNRYNLFPEVTALCALIHRFVTYSQLSVATPSLYLPLRWTSRPSFRCSFISTALSIVSTQLTATLLLSHEWFDFTNTQTGFLYIWTFELQRVT
jgi:hypothetical protein